MSDSPSKETIIVYFHVATVRYSVRIFAEIYKKLRKSGLVNDATEIHISVVGTKKFEIEQRSNVFIHKNVDLLKGEFVTLELLESHAKQAPDAKFLYIHTKGVTRFWNIAIRDWRRYMTYFLVEGYRDCIEALNHFDACGVDLVFDPVKHFSGNFWWANGKYLNQLPSIYNLSGNDSLRILSVRHNAEFWIGMGEGKFKSLWNSNINVYRRHLKLYPRWKYSKPKKLFKSLRKRVT